MIAVGAFADAVRAAFDTIRICLGAEVPEEDVEAVAALAEDEGRMLVSAFAVMPEFAGHSLIEES